MDYELAKELKDAGFPFKNWDEIEGLGVMPRTTSSILSELIHSCGEITLLVGKDKSVALNAKNPLESTERGEGLTPEIAVAKLWLALNGDKSKK